MTQRRGLPVLIAIFAVAFAAGFGIATLLGRSDSSAGVRGQSRLYTQILSDLQRDYYKPVDVARLGRVGIGALLKSLNDPYTVYFTPQEARQFSQELQGSYSGIGTVLDRKGNHLTVIRVFPGSPAAQAGVRPGDEIVAIGGKPTAGQALDAIVAQVQGPAGSRVHLQLRRAGSPRSIDVTLTRRQISVPLTSTKLVTDHGIKVGYVDLSAFASGAGRDLSRAIAGLQQRGARWLILDLRNNGGGLVDEAVKVASDFLPGGRAVVSTQGAHSPRDVLDTSGGAPTRLPTVVLVNRNTASAAEIVTGALQDYRRATIIGTRTFGKGVVQEVLPLSSGAALKITVASYRTPRGRDINHKGIEPTIRVSQNAGSTRDQVLQRALRFIATGH
jgi:carboxyl-terminal processing protease